MADKADNEQLMDGLPKAALANSKEQVRVRTERFRQIYANSLVVGFSTWDTHITFGEIIGDKDGQPVIEETVRVLITREIAKVFAGILTNHVKAFEEQFGEIKIPVAQETEAEAEPVDAETASPKIEAEAGGPKAE